MVISIVEGSVQVRGSVSGTDQTPVGINEDYNRAQRVFHENPVAIIQTATGIASFVGVGEVVVTQEGSAIIVSGTPHITEAGSDVSSVNAITGAVLITGTQNTTTQTSGQTVTITGPDLTSYATTAALVTVSGHLQDQIDTNVDDISDNTTLITTTSGHLQNEINAVEAGDVDSITASGTELTGAVVFAGVDGTYLHVDGQTITISGTGSGGGVTAHSSLTGLDADDHELYVLADGTRGFSATVSGVDPVDSDDLATKNYADTADTTISGHLQGEIDATQPDVDSLNSLTGDVTISGTGEVGVTIDGQYILVSGTDHTAGAAISGEFKFQTSIDPGPPAEKFRMDNASYASVTELFISDTAKGNKDATNYLAALGSGDRIYFQRKDDGGQFGVFDINSAVDDEGDWFRIPVDLVTNGDTISDDKACIVTFLYGGTPITGHGSLSGLENDDHPQYVRADGTRGFSATVSGVDPVDSDDLATKNYVDTADTTISGHLQSEIDGIDSSVTLQEAYDNGTGAITTTAGKPVTISGLAGVGIGTINPEESLDVTGSGIFTGDVIDRGITWTLRAETEEYNWRSVTYGDGLFVAVADEGTGDRVMTSPDGVNWTSRTSAADNDWVSVTYGNGLFVAVADDSTGDRVMTSPDGVNWTSRTSAADNNWRTVTYGNGLFVAVSNSGSGNRVMTSPDGINWTLRNSAADNSWRAVTYGNGLFVAVASNGSPTQIMTSPDGINWTLRTSAENNFWQGVTYANGIFVAVNGGGGGNGVMTSPDGITWTIRSTPTNAGGTAWASVTYGHGLFVAVSTGTGVYDRVMTSPDGINWTLRTSAADNDWVSVTYGNGLFVATAISAAISGFVMTSGKSEINIIPPSYATKNYVDTADTTISGHLQSEIDGIETGGGGTVSAAMLGVDGITVISGTPTESQTTISGSRDEFILASGTLQNDIDTNTGNIATNTSDISDNTTLITTTSGHLQSEIDNIDVDEVEPAIVGSDGITVTSGVSNTDVKGFYAEFVTASGYFVSEITDVYTQIGTEIDAHADIADAHHEAFTEGDVPAIVGADGITVISGASTTTVSGFYTEFTNVSGTFQTDIADNASDIADNASDISNNTTLITTTSGHLQSEIDNVDVDEVEPAIIGSDGITVISGATTTTVSGFYTEFTNASGTLQSDIDTNTGNISDNDTRITTTSGYLQNQIDDIESGEPAIVGSDGITVISGETTTTVSGFYTEFTSASGTLQDQIDGVTSVTLQDAYDDGDGSILLDGYPVVISGSEGVFFNVDTVAVSGMVTATDLLLADFAEGEEEISHILNEIVNSGVLDALVVTNEGGINISWGAGEIWNGVAKTIVETDANGSTPCTDDIVNYLYWDRSGGGTALTLGTTTPDAGDDDVLVATIYVQDGDIYDINAQPTLDSRETLIVGSLVLALPSVVISGLVVSEHVGAGAFDVDMTSGIWIHQGIEINGQAPIDSTVTDLRRWFHDGGGDWTSDLNAQIDAANYDTGTGISGNTSNQYYRSTFFLVNGVLHWVYPNTSYSTSAQAIAGVDPTKPLALQSFPSLMTVILRGNASAFPASSSDQWIDVRPIIGSATGGGAVSDHGELAGLTPDDDHPHYSLVAGTRAFTGTVGGITPTADDHLTRKDYVDGEIVAVSGHLQTSITTNTGDIADNTTLITTTSGHLQSEIDNVDVDEVEPAIIGVDGITVISGAVTTTVSGFQTEFVNASGSLQTQHDNHLADWGQNGFFNLTDSTVSFEDVSRTFEIEPTGASFDYVVSGTKHTVSSADSVVIDNTEGLWAIYYTGTTLTAAHPVTASGVDDIILNHTIVAYVYWDADNGVSQRFEERHGLSMAPATHEYLHHTAGARHEIGLALNNLSVDGDGSDNAHAQFGVDWGKIKDEDLEHDISAVSSTAGLVVLYQDNDNWRWDVNAGYSVLITGTGGYPQVNSGTGLDEMVADEYALTHVFASNALGGENVAIMGRATYSGIRDATQGAADELEELSSALGGMSPEMKALASIVLQASGINDVKAKFLSTDAGDEYIDWRGSPTTAELGPDDHGTLRGLGDDDHSQYTLADGSRAFTNEVLGVTPTALAGLTTKFYVDLNNLVIANQHVKIVGDTMTGALDIQDNLSVGSGTGGDSIINWKLNDTLMYVTGIDDSDFDKFKVSSSVGFGGGELVVVDGVFETVAISGSGGFHAETGFYPRRIKLDVLPTSGTGALNIDDKELVVWTVSGTGVVNLLYNDEEFGIQMFPGQAPPW